MHILILSLHYLVRCRPRQSIEVVLTEKNLYVSVNKRVIKRVAAESQIVSLILRLRLKHLLKTLAVCLYCRLLYC